MLYTECPNCHQPISRPRLFFTTAWGRWRCAGCGALLGIDVRRRFLAMLPWALFVFALFGVLRIASQGLLISVPILIAAALATFFYFDRLVVHERTGFRCRGCGYDLQGQTEPRCPECGLEFDLARLGAFQASAPRPQKAPSRMGIIVLLVLVIVFLATLMVVGLTRYRGTRGGAAATQPGQTGGQAPSTRPADGVDRPTEARRPGTAHEASGASDGAQSPAPLPPR